MVAAANIKAPQARVLAPAAPGAAAELKVPQARTLAVANIPADFVKSSQARVLPVVSDPAVIELSQARVLAVVRGHIADPKVRAWTFTLDGHDFYVLHLGETKTLVYDTHSEQWYVWGSDTRNYWKAYTGCNWQDGYGLGASDGSNIVVGDDVQGVLYFLNPDGDEDDDPLVGNASPHTFERVTQGQVVLKGYNSQRCYSVELLGSIGDLSVASLTGIQLEYSDDRGNTYSDAGTVDVTDDDITARVAWRSLGSMSAPGRLFRITDYGALRRIDSLDMEGDEE